MGVAIPLSFNAQLKKGARKRDLFVKCVRRSIILYALGLFLNNGYYLQTWRIPGVLQRFGVSYLVVSLIVLFIPKFERQRASAPIGVNRLNNYSILTHTERKNNYWETINRL